MDLTFDSGKGPVSALLLAPPSATALLVLAHGAGAGMRHPFLEALAHLLEERSVATLRYQFPYMEARRGRTDPPDVAAATVAAAVQLAHQRLPSLPLFAGGKSFGGRMTSTAASEGSLPLVRGLVFLGFPLHPPNRPGSSRADHLDRVSQPMLFLQGTRDDFADLTLLEPVIARLGPRAALHVVPEADHSFGVPKSAGRAKSDVMAELAGTITDWITGR